MKTIFRYNDGTFSNNPEGIDMCRMEVGDIVFLIDGLPRIVTNATYVQATDRFIERTKAMIQVIFLSDELVKYEPTELE